MKNHVYKLDALRGLAAQPVVLSHAAILVDPKSSHVILGWASLLAVIFFFILSGYVIVGGLHQSLSRTGSIDLKDFFVKRLARIYPPYLFTIIAVVIFSTLPHRATSPIHMGLYPWTPGALIRALTFAFHGTDPIVIAPVWSLRLEVCLYVISGLLFAALAANGLIRMILAIGVAVFSTIFFFSLAFAFASACFFALGGVAYLLTRNIIVDQEHRAWMILAPTGGWSYTLYLIHMPIVAVVVDYLTLSITDPIILIVLCCLVANIISFALSTFLERPKFYASLLRRLTIAPALRL